MAYSQIKTLFNLHLRMTDLGDKGAVIQFDADRRLCGFIQNSLNLLAVNFFSVNLTVKRDDRGDGAYLVGHVTANVVQSCVISLEPVRQFLNVEVKRHFVPSDHLFTSKDNEIVMDLDLSDELEPFNGQDIDLATMLLEAVALEIEPYPRANDVFFDNTTMEADPKSSSVSPFQILAQLKQGRD